jgi:hypothetical protein
LTAVSAIFLDLLFGFQRPIPPAKTGQVVPDLCVWGALFIVAVLRPCQVLKYCELLGFPASEAAQRPSDAVR